METSKLIIWLVLFVLVVGMVEGSVARQVLKPRFAARKMDVLNPSEIGSRPLLLLKSLRYRRV